MTTATLTLTLAACLAAVDDAPPAPLVERYLVEGRLADGEKAALEALEKDPKDAQARFGLGVVQFLRGVERMAQALHRYGLRSEAFGNLVPFLRLPVPRNDEPAQLRYEDLRSVFRTWLDDMARAEATLAKVDDEAVKLRLHFGRVRLDLDGDGRAGDAETLWRIYARYNARAQPGRPEGVSADEAEKFVIAFDRGDVAWLRGYCHLLSALAEAYLAYDARDLFNHSAHLVFARPVTPYTFLKNPGDPQRWFNDTGTITDLIATVHMIRLPVVEPRRMAQALRHIEAMLRLSRESWKHYLAETDDDAEWISNPKQSTVMPGGKVTDEMVKGWTEFLDEAEAIFAGKVLVPFWRDPGGSRGVNLRRVFTEPHGFDLVLWVQGTAAAPYLEEGTITKPELWQRMQRLFRGEFIGFALWFN
jgi:hypothetical protein